MGSMEGRRFPKIPVVIDKLSTHPSWHNACMARKRTCSCVTGELRSSSKSDPRRGRAVRPSSRHPWNWPSRKQIHLSKALRKDSEKVSYPIKTMRACLSSHTRMEIPRPPHQCCKQCKCGCEGVLPQPMRLCESTATIEETNPAIARLQDLAIWRRHQILAESDIDVLSWDNAITFAHT